MIKDDQKWHLHFGDTIEHMAEMPDHCMDMAVYSPPFPAVYAYSDSERDIGNNEDLKGDAKIHLSFFYHQLARIVKPGRAVCVHVMQTPRLKRSGEVGLNDFRGLNIRLGERSGLVYEYDWVIRKNPQAQALRTRSRELQFAGLESDRAKSRGTLCDYILKFRVPGENKIAVDSENEVSRNDWIKWAEGTWSDIQESDTLNIKEGRSDDDTRHICPLQLEVTRRLILLYTNPDEIVFSPFAGIGSEGYVALGGKSPKTKLRINNPRRFYGCELKPEYYAAALKNLAHAEQTSQSDDNVLMLF